MFLIVGLGNKGDDYKKTRHNAGFLVLDKILNDEAHVWSFDKYANAEITYRNFGGKNVAFVKPMTFMNNSGNSVNYLLKEEKISLSNFVLIYDDVDLAIGTLKVSHDKGDGGHNGLKSIIKSLGGRTDFGRIRVGVSPVDEEGNLRKSKNTADYVLKDFTSGEMEKLSEVSVKVKKAIEIILSEGIESAMNKVN